MEGLATNMSEITCAQSCQTFLCRSCRLAVQPLIYFRQQFRYFCTVRRYLPPNDVGKPFNIYPRINTITYLPLYEPHFTKHCILSHIYSVYLSIFFENHVNNKYLIIQPVLYMNDNISVQEILNPYKYENISF